MYAISLLKLAVQTCYIKNLTRKTGTVFEKINLPGSQESIVFMIMEQLKKRFMKVSIRTVLFSILLIIGGWGIVASLYQIEDSLVAYRQDRNLSEWAPIATRLLAAAHHLAYERGRTVVVMRGIDPVSSQDRDFLNKRRSLADSSLQAALESADNAPELKSPEIINKWEKLKQLRRQIDHNVTLPRASRDQGLSAEWFDTASDLIRSIQSSTVMLISYFNPKEKTTRLTLLAAAVLELRITAGAESAVIAETFAAKEVPTIDQRNYIHNLRGREDRLWNEIDRFSSYLKIPELQNRVDEVKKQHLTVYRLMQDQALSDLGKKGQSSFSIEKLTSSSIPVLDGLSELMTIATVDALQIADKGMAQARAILIRHILWALSLIVLLTLSVRYILKHVIKPLEFVDSEIIRLGALPAQSSEAGNEIDRLMSSTVALEHSLIARAKAEEELKTTVEELTVALDQVKTLSGLLPICASCKKIRDDKGYWEQAEAYISKRTDAQFSHGYCPDCAEKVYAEIEKMKKERSEG